VKYFEKEIISLMHKQNEIASTKSYEIEELKKNLEFLEKNNNEMKVQLEKAQVRENQDDSEMKRDADDAFYQTVSVLEKLTIVENEKLALEDENNVQKAEAQSLFSQIEQKTSDYEALELELNEFKKASAREVEILRHQLKEKEEKFLLMNAKHDQVLKEKETLEGDIENFLAHHQEQMNQKHNEALLRVKQLEQETAFMGDHLQESIKVAENVFSQAIVEIQNPGSDGKTSVLSNIAKDLEVLLIKLNVVRDKLSVKYGKYNFLSPD